MPKGGNNCTVCDKVVYLMEQIEIEGHKMHKTFVQMANITFGLIYEQML